jgi:hypothetical protein
MMSRNEIPSFEKGLKQGIRWKPEPPGAEHFDHAKTVLARKWGDCDDLAPWHAASLRHSGEDPDAKAIVKRSGPKTWHAVVQRADGSIDDPSREAGMGPNIAHGVRGAVVPLMFPNHFRSGQRSAFPSGHDDQQVGAYIIRPKIAMRPVRGAYQSRTDMPWHWREHLDDEPSPTDYAMTSLHTAPVASTTLTGTFDAARQSLIGSIDGACELAVAGGYAHPEHLDRLCCIADAVEGADWDELAAVYGEEHADAAQQVVGSFFGSIAKGFKSLAPIISKGVQFIPGVGPIASSALDMATKLIPAGAAANPIQAARIVQPGGGVVPARIIQPSYPQGAAATQPGGRRYCFPPEAMTFG